MGWGSGGVNGVSPEEGVTLYYKPCLGAGYLLPSLHRDTASERGYLSLSARPAPPPVSHGPYGDLQLRHHYKFSTWLFFLSLVLPAQN